MLLYETEDKAIQLQLQNQGIYPDEISHNWERFGYWDLEDSVLENLLNPYIGDLIEQHLKP